MGAIGMRVQTADENITSNPHTPVNQANSNYCFWLKCEYSITNIVFASEKSSCLNQEICAEKSTVYKQKQF